MVKKGHVFIFLGLGLVIVLLAAFFSTSIPGGLEFAFEKLGVQGAIERGAPMKNYTLPFWKNGVSIFLSGLIGVIFFLGFFPLFALIKKGSGK